METTKVARFVFKARSKTFNIKTLKYWYFTDIICVGCGLQSEAGDEILIYDGLSDGKFKDILTKCYGVLLLNVTVIWLKLEKY